MRLSRALPVLLFVLLVLPASNAESVVPPDLVGWWSGEGTAEDSSAFGNDGVLLNGATFATGVLGQAFRFDGNDDRVDVPDAAQLDLAADFTISLWVKPAAGTQKPHANIFRKEGGGSNGYGIEMTDPVAANDYLAGWKDSGGGAQCWVAAPFSLTPDVWQHLAVVKEGAERRVYVDGSLDPAATCLGTDASIASNAAPLQFGSWSPYGTSRSWDGLLDEIMVFDRDLERSELLEICDLAIPEHCSVCGNGVLETGEVCDDGNTQPGDCCDAGCQAEVGPGVPPCCSASGFCQAGDACGAVCFSNSGTCQVAVGAVTGRQQCACNLDTCPLGPGQYVLTQTASVYSGVWMSVLLEGIAIVIDVGAGDVDCIHPVVVPEVEGFVAPVFCGGLGFGISSFQIVQAGCGVGILDSNGGSDVTLASRADTSSLLCGGEGPFCSIPSDRNMLHELTIGDAVADACASGGTGNLFLSIPVTMLVYQDTSGCPGDGYDPGVDELRETYSFTLDLTTDQSSGAVFDSEPADTCTWAGLPGGGPGGAAGTCIDYPTMKVDTAFSSPLWGGPVVGLDLGFFGTLPTSISAKGAYAGATCPAPPSLPPLPGGGTVTRCLP